MQQCGGDCRAYVHVSVLCHDLELLVLISPQPKVVFNVIGWIIWVGLQQKCVIRCHDTIDGNGTVGCQWGEDTLGHDIVFNLDNLEWFHAGSSEKDVTLFQIGWQEEEFLLLVEEE